MMMYQRVESLGIQQKICHLRQQGFVAFELMQDIVVSHVGALAFDSLSIYTQLMHTWAVSLNPSTLSRSQKPYCGWYCGSL